MPDVRVENHGSIMLFQPLTIAGTNWLDTFVPDAQYMGFAAAVEPRYAQDIAQAMIADGLEVV